LGKELTWSKSLVALNCPAKVRPLERLNLADARSIIKVNCVLDKIALAATLAIKLDVNEARGLTLLNGSVRGCRGASNGKSEGNKTSSELHFENGDKVVLEIDCRLECLSFWVVRF
jgi:hypothetical protein